MNQPPVQRTGQEGFTLAEVAVAVMVFGLIMAFSFGVFAQLNQSTISNSTVARTQSSLRAAMDEITRTMRSAGVDIDYANGQRNIVYADGFQLAFNANIWPSIDDGTGFPQALQAGAAGSGVPSDGGALYTAPFTFAFGAETIMYTLDGNRDGAINATDRGDDAEESTTNPNDYLLYRHSFGWDGNANTVDSRKVALTRGPDAGTDGVLTPPLFSYWIDADDNKTTPPILLGDANNDGTVNGAEAAAVGALTAPQLARIVRVALQLTGETATPTGDQTVNDGYIRVNLDSEVGMRQAPRTTAVVFGMVYHDRNEDGALDVGEEGLSGVRISGSGGRSAITGPAGNYMLALPPGAQTITEDDPIGYASVSPNGVAVNLYRGEFKRLDFSDISNTGTGIVSGVVFHDIDENGVRGGAEPGIANVQISADSGEGTTTTSSGAYSFEVPFGNRVITETDSTGYASTTPNEVSVFLDKDNTTGTIHYGDVFMEDFGTIEGYVFNDENSDGYRNNGETGVPGADIVVSGQSVTSDNTGFFSISVPAGTHKVTELDPPGYTSTTPNTFNAVFVVTDEITTVLFGDIVQEDVDFDIIELAETEQALSISAGNLDEDNRGDPDLFLGTRFTGGSNNLLVWYNERKNHQTPNSAIFNSTPSMTRATGGDVATLSVADFSGNGAVDIAAGYAVPSGINLTTWYTNNSGVVPSGPDLSQASTPNGHVLDTALADFNNDGRLDLLLGVESGANQGHFEIWPAAADGSWDASSALKVYSDATGSGTLLGAIHAVTSADFDGDGNMDAIVASRDNGSQSSVHVYRILSSGFSISSAPWQSISLAGSATDLIAVDMVEDDAADIDIVISYEIWSTVGGVELWLQDAAGHFGMLNEGVRSRDDNMDIDGSPLVMEALLIDNDIFPDLVIGTRTGASFQGHIDLARAFGYLPSQPQRVTGTSIGEVITLTDADFNQDNIGDLAAGTRNSSSTGRVYLLYRN